MDWAPGQIDVCFVPHMSHEIHLNNQIRKKNICLILLGQLLGHLYLCFYSKLSTNTHF